MAFIATEIHYKEQPGLWKMGEWGRARTLEDYGHHFITLSTLDEVHILIETNTMQNVNCNLSTDSLHFLFGFNIFGGVNSVIFSGGMESSPSLVRGILGQERIPKGMAH